MTSWPDCPPLQWEIKEQLARILASRRLVNAPNPSAFLEFVVERALDGKQTPGHLIAKKLFAGKFLQHVSNDVRQTKANLCKTLDRFYAAEGKDDAVIIYFPAPPGDPSIKLQEGEAYTPLFKYNPRLEAMVISRLAYKLLDGSTYSDFTNAYTAFSELLSKTPVHIGATIGLVETFCKFAERNWSNCAQVDPLATCKGLLKSLPSESGKYWRYWAAKGFIETSMADDAKADVAYERALTLDRAQTENYVPYIYFVFQNRPLDLALSLANRYLQAHLEESFAHTQYAYFMALAQRNEEVDKALGNALVMDAGNRGAHELSAMVAFLKGDVRRFADHIRILRTVCDPTSFALIVELLEKYEEQHGRQGWTKDALESKANAVSGATEKRQSPPRQVANTAHARRPSSSRRSSH